MRTLLLVLTIVTLAVPAGADGCVCACDPPLVSAPRTGVSYSALFGGDTSGDNPGQYYVDNDLCQPEGCLFSVWIYEETNGIAGLQRGDGVVDDTCGGAISADTLVLL